VSEAPVTYAAAGRRLLLLSPSSGLSGGIERVMDAVEAGWRGPVRREDLLRAAHPSGAMAPQGDGPVSRAEIARFTARVLRSAATSRPDVVVCGLLGLLPLASAVAHPLRRKLVLLGYGVEVWGRIGPVERRLVRRCWKLLTISSYTAAAFGARTGVDPREIRIVALPIAASIEAAARAAGAVVAGHGERPPVVLTVSRLARSDRFKGHFDIARCFGRVLERRPDATWVVVGDGDDLPALRAECRRLGIDGAVTFTGPIGDGELIALYRTAAVFALPSYADADADPPVGEGFGLVYAEAGAFGLPIIAATPGGGSADFVTDGETGLTVPAHDVDALAAAILRLLDEPGLRAALGGRARSRALERHTQAHFSDALHAALA